MNEETKSNGITQEDFESLKDDIDTKLLEIKTDMGNYFSSLRTDLIENKKHSKEYLEYRMDSKVRRSITLWTLIILLVFSVCFSFFEKGHKEKHKHIENYHSKNIQR